MRPLHKSSLLLLVTVLIGASLISVPVASAEYYPISQCTLTVTVNLPGAGSVIPGTGLYYYGDLVVARVYTNLGYSFDGWYLNGVYQGKLSSIPITMYQDYQLLAVFSKRVVALTITANPISGGTVAPGVGIWTYTFGDSVIVKEFVNAGYAFSGWYLDGTYQGLGSNITVNMNQDHQLGAFFAGGSNTPPPTQNETIIPTPPPNPNLPAPNLSFYCTSSTTSSGFNVKIQGELSYNGVGISGTGILFFYSVTGGATWQELAYVTTGDDGNFTAVWMPSASGNYAVRAIYAGDDVYSAVIETVNFAVAPFDNEDENVFSVASNSTLSSLAFDSATSELSFGVSGPSETAGYVQVCIPKALLSDAADLVVTLDGETVAYNALSDGDIWIITFMYNHSTHKVVMALSAETSGQGLFGNQLIFVVVIAVLIAIIAGLIILNRRKPKSAKNT